MWAGGSVRLASSGPRRRQAAGGVPSLGGASGGPQAPACRATAPRCSHIWPIVIDRSSLYPAFLQAAGSNVM